MTRRLLLGTSGAVAGALAGAIAWAAITAATTFQIGYMAVGVGFLAGYGMRVLGGGRDRADGVIAGVVSLLGCVVGNVLAVVMTVANHQHMTAGATLNASIAVLTHPSLSYKLLMVSFSIMDVLFYAIAVYAGYRTAMKPPAMDANAEPHAPLPAQGEPTTPLT